MTGVAKGRGLERGWSEGRDWGTGVETDPGDLGRDLVGLTGLRLSTGPGMGLGVGPGYWDWMSPASVGKLRLTSSSRRDGRIKHVAP